MEFLSLDLDFRSSFANYLYLSTASETADDIVFLDRMYACQVRSKIKTVVTGILPVLLRADETVTKAVSEQPIC